MDVGKATKEPSILAQERDRREREWENAARKLRELDDIRSTGFLLEALDYEWLRGIAAQELAVLMIRRYYREYCLRIVATAAEPGVPVSRLSAEQLFRALAVERLTVLLPRLKASDAGLLTEKQRARLNRQIGKVRIDREAPLLLAMLKALEQVGDERSALVVRALTSKAGDGEAAARVRAAAREALPAVEQSAERWRNAAMLLRPADASATPDETLLRPASGAAADRAEERLLRPSASDT
ncbi:MAG TPA: hypothetical protein VLH79_16020 [Chthonomonadales bacterium]|nr:hypothetical protein [Chthonomonadales bacterium]